MESLKERLYLSVPHMSEASLRYVEGRLRRSRQ